jgi:hypothetical protein
MTAEVRIGILRARAEALLDLEERGRLVKLLDDLSRITNLVDVAERRPKTMAKYGIGPKHIENARWVRDRLDEEISGRISKAEGSR